MKKLLEIFRRKRKQKKKQLIPLETVKNSVEGFVSKYNEFPDVIYVPDENNLEHLSFKCRNIFFVIKDESLPHNMFKLAALGMGDKKNAN